MKKPCIILIVLVVILFLFVSALADEYVVPASSSGKDLLMNIHVVPDAPLNGDAAAKYISQIMPHKKILQVSRPSGLMLSEPSKSVYMALREFVSKVAAGEISHTEYTIPYEDLFDTSFTAEDLGIDQIIKDGAIPDETLDAAQAAISEQLDKLDPGDIINSLIMDAAYELYWHDKTTGHGTQVNYVIESFQATESTITVDGYMSFQMSVSQDYAVRSVSGQGVTICEEYEVDTEYGRHVQLAAENAQAIITENKNKSDEEKLAAYRDAICALTDYNYAAAEGEIPYGNPWQIVWVFDGDPDTQVVCEGYAKAFQYLCDLGTKEMTAICVQGETSGPHMWNIVTANGHNYLVDLTQYDGGFEVFMKGCSDGDPSTGYTIHHNYGTTKYTYTNMQNRSTEELTLYTMDYTEWKEEVAKIPEVQVSSDILYPGTAILARIDNENPELVLDSVVIRQAAPDGTGEPKTVAAEKTEDGNYLFQIHSAGECTFAVIRDGVESPQTVPMMLIGKDLPDESVIRLPSGAEILEEAFAGDVGIERVEAENCILRTDSFTGSGTVLVYLNAGSTMEERAFDDSIILCIDDGSEWIEDYRFVISE